MSVLGHRLRAYVRPSSAFDPGSITGLQLWFDAADASSFTYHSGVVVSQWNDKSGNARHAVQATSGVSPDRNGTQNSLTTVVFNGGKWMNNTGYALPTNATIFVVGNRTSGGPSEYMQFISGHTNNWTLYSGGNPQYMILRTVPGAVLAQSTTSPTGGTTYLITGKLSPTAGSIRIDRTLEHSDTVANTLSGTGFAVGAGAHDGQYPATGGMLAEMIVYDSVLGSTDTDSVEIYLRDKWGTA